jgi:hypothetical protein
MMLEIDKELSRMVLSADVQTLRDISDMLIREGSFRALPGILNSIANDISNAIIQSEASSQ